jgi:hypothetical protein
MSRVTREWHCRAGRTSPSGQNRTASNNDTLSAGLRLRAERANARRAEAHGLTTGYEVNAEQASVHTRAARIAACQRRLSEAH